MQPRRRGGVLLARFLEILVVAAARWPSTRPTAASQGWVPVIAPALVALAAGQVVAWLLALTPRSGRRLGPALTTPPTAPRPRPGLGASGSWSRRRCCSRSPSPAAGPRPPGATTPPTCAPVARPSSRSTAGGLRAYAASHDADPDGPLADGGGRRSTTSGPTSAGSSSTRSAGRRWSATSSPAPASRAPPTDVSALAGAGRPGDPARADACGRVVSGLAPGGDGRGRRRSYIERRRLPAAHPRSGRPATAGVDRLTRVPRGLLPALGHRPPACRASSRSVIVGRQRCCRSPAVPGWPRRDARGRGSRRHRGSASRDDP